MKALYRVLRGGSWVNFLDSLRASYRVSYEPDYRYYNDGFRLVVRIDGE